MDAVVDKLASPVVPNPMPIVVDEIILIRTPGSGSLPKFVVDMGWGRGSLAFADRTAGIVIPSTGESDFAD